MVGIIVTASPETGRIWIDKRKESGGFMREDGLDFDGWIDAWLTECEREAEMPWSAPKNHPNKPDIIVDAATIVSRSEIDALVADIRGRLVREKRFTTLYRADQLCPTKAS